jgi:hypothetical protein
LREHHGAAPLSHGAKPAITLAVVSGGQRSIGVALIVGAFCGAQR